MGGARHALAPPDRVACGSSPRGRGTVRIGDSDERARRFIPAWAGHGAYSLSAESRAPVHPRVGGARLFKCGRSSLKRGSSPRGRGTDVGLSSANLTKRFIPAWAGHGHRVRPQSNCRAVHPRVGGARLRYGTLQRLSSGSSPRGRGTARARTARRIGERFIPAWAGHGRSTDGPFDFGRFIPAWAGHGIGQPLPPPSWSVHPRVGGARRINLDARSCMVGSSPRGRGTVRRLARRLHLSRFIPAWAGHGTPASSSADQLPVHPRVGGARSLSCVADNAALGSSPRGRGTVSTKNRQTDDSRFIPAWAGHGITRRTGNGRHTVHPRVGGARAYTRRQRLSKSGSSPRGRGTVPLVGHALA